MNKFTMLAAIVMLSCSLFADGRFVVTQYNLNFEPSHLGQVDHIINTPSLWDGAPITATYHTISFANSPWTDYDDAITYFTTRSFQGWKLSWKSDTLESVAWFVTKIVGKVSIPREGFWTFAMGHDDGFKCRIFRGDHQFVFSAEGDTWLSGAREIKTIEFPEVGLYNIEILHYQKGGPALLEFSMAEGSHTSFRSSVFKLVEAAEGNYAVSFNANGGTGAMECQVFKESAKEKLLKNAYQKAGYVFQGWVTNSAERAELAANGTIDVDYKDEQEIMVDFDMTLYAVWANPALTLTAESADWSSGSITLRCEDSDTSGATHEYTLEYKNAIGAWEEVDGAKNKLATKGQDANGQEVWIAKLTDGTFWSRLGGIPPVEYRVKDENGRMSEGCVTRNRFLLSVGYSKFLTKNTPKRGHYNDASEIKSLCVDRGEFPPGNAHFRSNADATTEKVRGEMSYFATQTKPGDIFVFYIATHGGDYDSKRNALLATYDGGYQVKDLLDDVRTFSSGVAVVNIIMSCHSFALTGSVNASERINQWLVACGFGQCLGNVAWVTSCDAQQSSYTYLDEDHSRFGQSFIVNGFGQGCADMKLYGTEYGGGDKDGFITIGELGRYSKEFFKGLSEDMPSSVQLENDGLIDRIVLGRRTGVVAWSRPEIPSSINASQGDMKIDISWAGVGNATNYRVYRYPLDSPSEFKWIGISAESRYKDDTAMLKIEYGYRVRAVNPIGVSDLSYVAIGSRGTSKFIEFLNSLLGVETASADEYDAMEKTTAANGCRTVGECYALGINPEDPDDDFRITHFEMKDGKPIVEVNHTEDGSGNSFQSRIKMLGKAELSDEWQEVPDGWNPDHRFFTVTVEAP